MRRIVCESAVIWAMAPATWMPGWKKTRITATPGYEFDSMCSMSLTAVVMKRSSLETMRSAISCGGMPA